LVLPRSARGARGGAAAAEGAAAAAAGTTMGVRGRAPDLPADLTSRLRSSARALPGAGAGKEEEVSGGCGGGGGVNEGGACCLLALGGKGGIEFRPVAAAPATLGSLFSRDECVRPIIVGGGGAVFVEVVKEKERKEKEKRSK
jgi:hypothetical protein